MQQWTLSEGIHRDYRLSEYCSLSWNMRARTSDMAVSATAGEDVISITARRSRVFSRLAQH